MELSDLDERNAIEEEFGPQRPGGGGIVDDAYLRAIEEEFGPQRPGGGRWSSPFFLQSDPSQPNESFRRIWCHHGAGALWRS